MERNETAAPAPGPARIIHTPAPWHEGELNGKGSIFAEDDRMRMEDSGTTLYSICRMIDTWEEVEDAGNSKIVVAAPRCTTRCSTSWRTRKRAPAWRIAGTAKATAQSASSRSPATRILLLGPKLDASYDAVKGNGINWKTLARR